MEARTALRQEAAHRALGRERPEQLDAALTDGEGDRFHALLLDHLPMMDGQQSQPLTVEGDGLVEVGDG